MIPKGDSRSANQDALVNYFAYGSNMSSRRILSRVPSARVFMRARLIGYQLCFHKHSLVDGSAKCDAYLTGAAEDVVWGVLFSLDKSEKTQLDVIEGDGYVSTLVEVELADGGMLQAMTYRATMIKPELKPFDWYKRHVLEGAREHDLPSEYIAGIEAVKAVADADIERRARELGIYL